MNGLSSALIENPNGIESSCIKFDISETTNPFIFHQIVKKEQEYTFSAWVKAEGNFRLNIENQIIDIDSEWKKIKVTFTAGSNNFYIYFLDLGTYYFFETQLEEGSTMSSWTPAPEDIDANLELKVNSDDLISEINASANVIRLKSNRLVVESDNLQISENGTLKTQRGEIGGFILADHKLTAEVGRYAEININYSTHADAEVREGYIRIGNEQANTDGSGEGGIQVLDYAVDGRKIYTEIGNVLDGGILITTEEPHDALHINDKGISRVDGNAVWINKIKTGEFVQPVLADRTDFNNVMEPNIYIGANADTSGYLNCPITNSNTFILEVFSCGVHGQILQRITTCDATNPRVWIRTYYSSTWFDWIPIIYDSGWNNAYSGYCQYRAKNGWCTVKGVSWGDYSLPAGEYRAISTIPVEYRPKSAQHFAATSIGNQGVDIFGYIETDGILWLYSSANYSYWSYSVTYPI